jgi:5-methylcytosine-specific restriction endonuclease McrA
MIQCENCNKIHDGNFGSGRFCSKSCSRSFSTKKDRARISEKVSKKLLGQKFSNERKLKLKERFKDPVLREKIKRKLPPIETQLIENSHVSTKHIKERLILEGLKPNICEECGISDTYNGKPITNQLHHINGNPKDHRIFNLQILCPNCHSQTDNWSGKGRRKRSSTHSSTGIEHLPTKHEVTGSSPVEYTN